MTSPCIGPFSSNSPPEPQEFSRAGSPPGDVGLDQRGQFRCIAARPHVALAGRRRWQGSPIPHADIATLGRVCKGLAGGWKPPGGSATPAGWPTFDRFCLQVTKPPASGENAVWQRAEHLLRQGLRAISDKSCGTFAGFGAPVAKAPRRSFAAEVRTSRASTGSFKRLDRPCAELARGTWRFGCSGRTAQAAKNCQDQAT